MTSFTRFLALVATITISTFGVNAQSSSGSKTAKDIPAELMSWADWATWSDLPEGVPFRYDQRDKKLSVWSSTLDLSVGEESGRFSYQVEVYHDAWVSLPGDRSAWPLSVKANGEAIAVMAKGDRPSVYLKPGSWEISGVFRWAEMPQTVVIPKVIGILKLARNGADVEAPNWGRDGKLWLKRTTKEAADKNYLSAQVYRNLVDGAPMWLLTDVELTVTGKSREEELGAILPEGWHISSLTAQIPCAVDDDGLLKAQVRAGKWVISIKAFRTTPAETISYAEGAEPLVAEELVSLRNQANFRVIEFSGLSAVDVAQTTFPQKWRNLPLYLWTNKTPFSIVEKMRGMGQKKAAGISIKRDFWLDEDGKQMTYRDVINGQALQTWRLDAAAGQRLGAAKIGGDSQLITKNPVTGATGVEVRVRNLNLQSVGRMDRAAELSATGWQYDAEALEGRLYTPPGWRVFAVFGPDSSYGDWLTAWSLLDVFFLLIFTVAIFRLWGWKLGLLAFGAFVLSYHEPGMPKVSWLFLLISIVLYSARAVQKSAKWKQVTRLLAYASAGLILLGLVPFVKTQLQQAIYPQLENHSIVGTHNYGNLVTLSERAIASSDSDSFGDVVNSPSRRDGKKFYGSSLKFSKSKFNMSNLKYDSKAKIQTGPAVPEWSWRSVRFSWSGPVSADEKVSFVLIPLWLQRIITVVRVIFIMGLFYLLLCKLKSRGGSDKPTKERQSPPKAPKGGAILATIAITLVGAMSTPVYGQYPDAEMLKTLRERLLQDEKGISQYAEIPELDLKLEGNRLTMGVTIHTAKKTAVPLPGKLPVWSPVSVSLKGGGKIPVSRINNYLWVVLEEGTHRVNVEGVIANSDWEWSFLLKPQYVNIDAEGWVVTGVKPDGIPENQVFFVPQNREQGAEADYDRKDFNPVLKVTRDIELGLIWQSQTTVQRLSPLGKAVSMSLPLLPGERILSSDLTVKNGRVEIRLGAQQASMSWGSELSVAPEIKLESELNSQWVEQWQVTASPVWNLSLGGLDPIFHHNAAEVVPIWKPWPGESATLRVSRPDAIEGETMTILQAIHKMNMGSRQRSSSLKISLQTSIGTDFVMSLAPEAQVSSLTLNGVETAVRKEGNQVVVPLRPGKQSIELAWKTPQSLTFKSLGDEVKLPVDCANTSSIITLSRNDRWVLWADGPRRGPAVRMWGVFIFVVIFGVMLGRLKQSPLKSYEWVLLLLGLSQIELLAGFFIVAWFFWVGLRGIHSKKWWNQPSAIFNFNQIATIAAVIPVTVILLMVLHKGLLGSPEMRILGEGSGAGNLRWFEARSEGSQLPIPWVVSVSIWFYRGLMLLWAVWLAFGVLRWAQWAFEQVGEGGFWMKSLKSKSMNAPAADSVNQPVNPSEPDAKQTKSSSKQKPKK